MGVCRCCFAGDLIGVDGIKVEAISIEQAEGYGDELAPKGVDGDADTKYKSDIAYISVLVIVNSQSPSLAVRCSGARGRH